MGKATHDSDSETSDDTTTDEKTEFRRSHLHDDTDAENEAGEFETPATTEEVGSGSANQSTDESTGRENRDDEGGVIG